MPGFKERLDKKKQEFTLSQESAHDRVMNALKSLPEWSDFQAACNSSELSEALAELKKYGPVYKLQTWSNQFWPELTQTYIVRLDNQMMISFYIRIGDKKTKEKLTFAYHSSYDHFGSKNGLLASTFDDLLEFIAEKIACGFPVKVDSQDYAEIRHRKSIDELLSSWPRV